MNEEQKKNIIIGKEIAKEESVIRSYNRSKRSVVKIPHIAILL